MTIRINLRDNPRLWRKLRNISNLKGVSGAIGQGAKHVEGKIKRYPPSTAANKPRGPGSTWYERGFGSKYMRVDGGITGRKTSEALGRKWTIKQPNPLTAIVGNNVGYGIYVHGHEKQATFHGQRGWKTDRQVAEEESDVVLGHIEKAITKVVNG